MAARPYTKAPPKPVYDWSGFYLGVNGGWADQVDRRDLVFTNSLGVSLPPTPGLRADGGFGGGQIGYNWQQGAAVFGFEADIQGADITDSFPTRFVGLGTNLAASRKIDYFGTVRGRIGLAWKNVLFYVTGGFAYGDVQNTYFLTSVPPGSSTNLSDKSVQTGYAVGGGAEWLFAPNWSVKAEYQYIDLGSYVLSAPVVPPNGIVITANSTKNDFHTARVGVNYHFGGPVVAKY